MVNAGNFPADVPAEEPELDEMSHVAMDVYSQASEFGPIVQLREGDEKKVWFRTRRLIDHAGLELMLRDVEPTGWRRNTLRGLVAWTSACVHGRTSDPRLVEGLETWESIEERWSQLIRRWL